MIKSITIQSLHIPFKLNFKHHSAERNATQSLLVRATDGNLCGYGEACPREYVTGESTEKVMAFFDQIQGSILTEIVDLKSLFLFRKNYSQLEKYPAAWCAIEMALLDLFAKQEQLDVESLLHLKTLRGEFHYSAVIGLGSEEYFSKALQTHVDMGFSDFKLKIDGSANDLKKIGLIKVVLPQATIRLDANNIWKEKEEALEYINQLPNGVEAVEEPLQSKRIEDLAELSTRTNIPLIADESFTKKAELEVVLAHKEKLILNLRISKLGGLINSLEIADYCVKNNIRTIVGAQVGESSLLTRAALTLANELGVNCIKQEGAYGEYLLTHDIVENVLQFGKNGMLKKEMLNPKVYGWGLKMKEL